MRPRSSRHSPRLVDPQVLEQLTVGREALLDRLLDNMSAAIASGQGRFDLLVGPRGAGKSHLFGIIEARIRTRPELRERLVVVSLPEEFHPASLLHLLARVLQSLPEDPSLPVKVQLAALHGRDPLEAEDMAVAMIRARLGERALLVMLENLDAMFGDLGRKAQARLRQIVQTAGAWSIFATARSAIELTRQDEPFHGTFVVEQLDLLTPTLCREMMVRLARLHGQPELESWLQTDEGLIHVRGIHHLVGGSPRAIALTFNHLDPKHPNDLQGNFYRLAEEVTPYYQEQMTRLSAGQRPIMEFLAERWAPASVTEIAQGTFSEPTSVSTHLRALRRDRLVHSIAVGKERFYEIAEPLHRVARAMKRDERLAGVLARIGQIWALMTNVISGAELDREWLTSFCEADSRFVECISGQLALDIAEGRMSNLEVHVDSLREHVHAPDHPEQAMVLTGLLALGRDHEAYAHAKNLADSGQDALLARAYLGWLILSFDRPSTPLTTHFLLARNFAEVGSLSEILTEVYAAASPADRGHLTLRLVTNIGLAPIENVLRKYPCTLSARGWAFLLAAAWFQDSLDSLLGAANAIATNPPAFIEEWRTNKSLGWSTDNRWALDPLASSVHQCYVVDHWAEHLRKPSRVRIAFPKQSESVLREECIPLWIASGRDLQTLRDTLNLYVDVKQLSAMSWRVIDAKDRNRAFMQLGAEARMFARSALRIMGGPKTLAELPPEPA